MQDRSRGSSYKCTQLFGYRGTNQKIQEQDLISYIKFDQLGKYLAVGDRAGRVILFRTQEGKIKQELFKYYSEFQAYQMEFDPLHSYDISQQILGLSWMKAQGQYQKLLTMNSKYIKLWKIFERAQKRKIVNGSKSLNIPKFEMLNTVVNTNLQKIFPTKHQLQLIAMQQTNNQQYILCTDSVQTLMWNIQKSQTPYMIADLTNNNGSQDIRQNINCLRAHPSSDSVFVYGTNLGSIVLSDSRVSLVSKPLVFRMEGNRQKTNYFTQMISSYSSLVFLNNSRQVVGRDLLSVKVWDIARPERPMLVIPIQLGMKTKLCEMVQNDCGFDRFNISVSKDCNTLLTGYYSNKFHTIDINNMINTQYEINYNKKTITKNIVSNKFISVNKINYHTKIVTSDFNQFVNLFAVGSGHCFFIYSM